MTTATVHSSATLPTLKGSRSRRAYVLLAWALIGSVVAQVFIAGLAIFADGTRWDLHITVGRMMEALPLVMLVLAFSGRFPRRIRWFTAGLIGLATLQSGFIGLADALGTREIAALHPVNALAIFAVAWLLASRARSIATQRG